MTYKRLWLQTDLEGAMAASEVECAEACDMVEGCNGASYYPDPEAYFGSADMKNCWMKTFADACHEPMDALEEPMAILLLKPGMDCALPPIPINA